jgi:predicted PhzF superfamily epimerase YddE/YHI9
MELSIFQVDAFSNKVFGGNPAAICPLEHWLPDATLQAVANENNLAETAYFVGKGDGRYDLRWFTPAVEVDLCGHATLASAHVLFQELGAPGDTVYFHTKSGELKVTREGDLLKMDFPSRPPVEVMVEPGLIDAMGGKPREVLAARDCLLAYESEEEVLSLQPDMNALFKLNAFAFIATARGKNCDFVSRFFAPKQGIPEDPVTGSAHCTLIPYWAEKLGKTTLHARQVSARGGELFCRLLGDRVEIAGHSVLYLKGSIWVPGV